MKISPTLRTTGPFPPGMCVPPSGPAAGPPAGMRTVFSASPWPRRQPGHPLGLQPPRQGRMDPCVRTNDAPPSSPDSRVPCPEPQEPAEASWRGRSPGRGSSRAARSTEARAAPGASEPRPTNLDGCATRGVIGHHPTVSPQRPPARSALTSRAPVAPAAVRPESSLPAREHRLPATARTPGGRARASFTQACAGSQRPQLSAAGFA